MDMIGTNEGARRIAGWVAGLLATCAVPAFAQTATVPEATSGGSAVAGDANAFAEIIVTANRREEAIQKVPVAITAFNSDTLREQSISNPYDLNGRVPSLVVTSNATQRDADGITIRGQGQTYLAPVGVVNYFAEVPLIQGSIIANQGAPGTFFDLDALQVLRGPQGTLFGKNTTGGALLLGPKKPTNELGGYVQAQIGNYDFRDFEGAINLPLISDVLMVRVAAKKSDRDGYTKDVGTSDLTVSLPFQTPAFGPIVYNNSGLVIPGLFPNTGQARQPGVNDVRSDFRGKDYDDRHYWTARLGILFRPVEGVENYLVGYYSKSHNNGTGQVLYSVSDSHPTLINLVANSFGNSFGPGAPGAFTAADSTIAQALLARQQALGPRRVSLNNDQFYRLKNWDCRVSTSLPAIPIRTPDIWNISTRFQPIPRLVQGSPLSRAVRARSPFPGAWAYRAFQST
jgi:iron complex outermembrane recepter protein